MTSMRMQILSCVSLVDLVLVCSGAVHWREGGGMGWVMDVHANATSALWFSCCFVFCALVGRRGDRGISHRFLRCFPKISGQHCADPRLVAHASFDFHVYAFDLRAGVGKGGDGAGLMTSMRMRLTCTVPLSALCIDGEGGDGGMLMM